MNLGLLWGLPKAPFPQPLAACAPSHADVPWLRHPWVMSPAVLRGTRCIPPNLMWIRPSNMPAGPPLWGQRCPPPHWGGQQGLKSPAPVQRGGRWMVLGGRRRRKALRAGGRGSRRHPWLCPSLGSPQQLSSCLISSPRSRRPAGAGGQGQTKASLLTAPPRKGLFFSPSAFLFKPLSPRLGRGHGLISARARWEREGADGSQAAGAAGPAAASSRRADAPPTRGRINRSGGPWAWWGHQRGLPPQHHTPMFVGDKTWLGSQRLGWKRTGPQPIGDSPLGQNSQGNCSHLLPSLGIQ